MIYLTPCPTIILKIFLRRLGLTEKQDIDSLWGNTFIHSRSAIQSAVRINSGRISIIIEYKDASFRAPPSNQGLGVQTAPPSNHGLGVQTASLSGSAIYPLPCGAFMQKTGERLHVVLSGSLLLSLTWSRYTLSGLCVHAWLHQSHLWDPLVRSLPGSFVHGIFLARILETVAMPGSSQPRDQTLVSCMSTALQVGSLLLSHQGHPYQAQHCLMQHMTEAVHSVPNH